LLDETAHYIKCLATQVKVMQSIADRFTLWMMIRWWVACIVIRIYCFYKHQNWSKHHKE
jgi:preprotein translocase subunit SecG